MTEEQVAAIEARITHALRSRVWADVYIEDEAHEDLPALVAEVRRLQARVQDYERHCFMDCVNY